MSADGAQTRDRRKRGRPRKYASDGAAVASPKAETLPPTVTGTQPQGFVMGSMEAEVKKARGRPAGLGKKMQMDGLGSGGIDFTPPVITVEAGEDVSSKIMSFCQHGPRAICILSANGAISNVTLHQATAFGWAVTDEGQFEILSLSGSFLLSENEGQRTGGLSVSLVSRTLNCSIPCAGCSWQFHCGWA